MGIFDRIGRVIKANVNDMIDKAEDPEKILEQSIRDMSEDLIKMRQAVAQVIASQKRNEQEYNKNMQEAERWQQRAQLALTKGEEGLAREALTRKKTFAETAATLKAQLDQQKTQVEALRRNLIALESKISEAKTKKDMLKARFSAAKANEQLQSTLGSIGSSSSMAAFERMEDKVLQMEARSQAAGELAGMGVEDDFAKLESGSDVDDELAMMKAQLSGSSPTQSALPPTDSVPRASTPSYSTPVDDELEKLRRELSQG
jgi:phage shock protein A